MLRLFFSALLVTGLVSAASAQQLVPAPKKEFLDSAFVVLPSETGARYYRETVYTDSVAGTVKDYYLSGKLQSSGTFDHVRKFSAHGTLETWFESGQLESRSTYQHDQPQELLYYYPTGQLKRHERYTGTKRTLAQCFAADGKKVRFFEYRQRPVYPEGDGGERAVVLAVMHNVVYPPEALRDNITGKVLLRFVVSPAGEASRVEVTQSAHPMLDAAAILAVQNLKRFSPGLQDGKPVNVYYTVPVSFSIK